MQCMCFNSEIRTIITLSIECNRIFDDHQSQHEKHRYLLSFTEHSLSVTDMVLGFGYDPIIVSASEDRTCKVLHACFGPIMVL